MTSTTHETVVPGSLIGQHPDDGTMVDVVFNWTPGREPSGLSGPPENYDPGEGDDFTIVSPEGLSPEMEEGLVNWLFEHWDRPTEPDDPDWYRDQKLDDWDGQL